MKIMKKILFPLISGVLLLSSCAKTSDNLPELSPVPTAAPTIAPTIEPLPTPTPEVIVNIDVTGLRDTLQSMLSSYNGNWSVYVKELRAGNEILLNNSSTKAASVMKLFIMGAVLDSVNRGTLEYTSIQDDLYTMITESSNECANSLLLVLGNGSYAEGISCVNSFIANNGYDEYTAEYNGFEDPASFVGGSFNVTSVHDCGLILNDIYEGSCVSPEMSDIMLEILKDQQTDYKLVNNLPPDTVVANKSGEMDTVENDVGIVFSPNVDYIICVMSNDWSNPYSAIENIQTISQTVYEYFNPVSE
ncbi:MAG: serine hydrolase [Oscillospiraceae bacterium]|nr:serine hydrolase [Oscillospiraceae bacterium]